LDSETKALNAASLRFGRYELDLELEELRREGAHVKLRRQPFLVLAHLAKEPQRLHTREELRELIWGRDTYVDFDQGLNYCIKEIRAALGDDADKPLYIETLPRRGYRFIAPVVGVPQPAPAVAVPAKSGGARALGAGALLGACLLALALSKGGGARPEGARTMLAVLPLANLSGDAEQEYLCDGLTEELIAQLGRVAPERLGVIARTSAMQYKLRGKGLREIARELGVDFVVEGSVRSEQGRVHIRTSLVKVNDLAQLFSEEYDREAKDLLGLQGEVARSLARRIQITLSPDGAARTGKAHPADAEAQDLYLRGRYFWNRRDQDGLRRAIDYFERAIARQPGYALAYVGVADAYLVLGDHGYIPATESFPKAKAAAERALQLDDGLAEALATRAMVRGIHEWDWRGSAADFDRAIGKNPNYATAHHWYAHTLRAIGRMQDAVAEMRRARELDPLSLMINTNLAAALFHAGELPESEARYRRTLELDARWAHAHWGLGRNLLKQGRTADALAALREAVAVGRGEPEFRAALVYGLARAGRTAEARRARDELEALAQRRYVAAYPRAVAQAAIGERGQAFALLEQAYRERQSSLRFLKVDERLDSLRGDPRLAALLARMHLSPMPESGSTP
jgi:TolB-like protein/DNA-binding winged helix-turn-helix (wHTH) protein/Flp pilus assembly protein TadD